MDAIESRDLSWASFALSTTPAQEARISWVCRTQHLPLSRFPTSSGVFFFLHLAALLLPPPSGGFHLQSFSRLHSEGPSPVLFPPDVTKPFQSSWARSPLEPGFKSRAHGLLGVGGSSPAFSAVGLVSLSSGLSSVQTSVLEAGCLGLRSSRCSPGVLPLQGTSFPCLFLFQRMQIFGAYLRKIPS